MLAFEFITEFDNTFSLPTFLEQGEVLLECLSHLRREDGVR
jgi:hypothetical protein